MKKNLIVLPAILAIVALAACSKEEPVATEPAQTDDVTADEIAADEAPVTEELPAADPATDEQIEVVEESTDSDSGEDDPIVLAKADAEEAPRNWSFKEGTHFTRLVPTQPTVGGPDMVEVAEIFMYSCGACYNLEAPINQWAESRNPNVRFVRIPAIFNQLAALHAQLYYTEEVLAKNGKLKDPQAFRAMVFTEYHRRGNRIASEEAAQRLFERAGVDVETFQQAWRSFEVNQRLRIAQDLALRYGATHVPMIIVNGKYRTDGSMAGTYRQLMEIIDELTAREGVR